MCMPGMISNPNTEGIYKLLKNGAALVTTTQDILDNMDWTLSSQTSVPEEHIECGFEGIEQKVYELISRQESDVDDIICALKIEYAELITILTSLELDGHIKQIDGGRYTIC